MKLIPIGFRRLRVPGFVALVTLVFISIGACEPPTEKLHDDFTLTEVELDQLIGTLPVDIQDRIRTRSWYFLELLGQVLESPAQNLMLIDKEHQLPSEYAPDDLVRLNSYDFLVGKNSLSVSRAIIPDLLAMVEAARIDGIELLMSSAYRSYAYQADVYAWNVATYGEEQAKRESAEPGKSQHQLGTTIDFGDITDAFGETDAGKWLYEHGWEYGFSLSYPDGYEQLTGYRHEIWHYRYVGRVTSLLEREFFGSVQQYLLQFLDDNKTLLLNAAGGTE